ncbi:hypothetical protein [Nocardia vermiculata]|uniref:Uncharacterized protein n=1 Tax=Nocardia vermiculata TaxID=257274 RepID=A0A846Y233_9NOCA|nr:hypothetical protein [Nocardia vermiculata]NKY52040.1 hypothetical protein [Nocardia vermiculata]
MSRALPYKIPQSNVVGAEDWILTVDGEELPLPEAFPHWDYQTDLNLRRRVTVDVVRAREESGLAPHTALTLAATWRADGSKLKGCPMRQPVPESGVVELAAVLRGADLGGIVELDTALVLANRRMDTDRPIAARRAGSVLWSDRHAIRLQGDATQFPIAIVDFTTTPYPANAAWYLEIGSNLEAATMGTILLLVNEKNTAVADAVKRVTNSRIQDRLVMEALEADIARAMVNHALHDSEFSDEIDYEDDTLGATLQELIGRLFPARSIEDIRLLADNSPSRFEAELQAAVNLFGGAI